MALPHLSRTSPISAVYPCPFGSYFDVVSLIPAVLLAVYTVLDKYTTQKLDNKSIHKIKIHFKYSKTNMKKRKSIAQFCGENK